MMKELRVPSSLLLTAKPQAMLVDEYSTSVVTVKKEPPIAKMEAGNANRTNKQKKVHPIWTKKVYHRFMETIRYNNGPVDKIKYGLEKKVSNPYFLS